jgi:hypothetical protein
MFEIAITWSVDLDRHGQDEPNLLTPKRSLEGGSRSTSSDGSTTEFVEKRLTRA